MASRVLVTARACRLCRVGSASLSMLAPRVVNTAILSRLHPTAAMPQRSLAQSQPIRMYGSKKKGGKKGGKQSEEEADKRDPDEDPVDMDKMEKNMQARLERLSSELQSLRVGRANPALLNSVRVQLKGGTANLTDIALVTVKDAHNLLVIPNTFGEHTLIDTSIRNAGLGLNPRLDKNAVIVPVPKTTKESREKLIKGLGGMAEQTRVQIRKVRHDAMRQLKTAAKASLPKDEVRSWEKDIQTATDKYIAKAEELLKAKARDIEQA
ncbi:hypothetical protein IW148_004049 [Coemansia sp. RSA 1199]|nr:hypothetical protein IW148_004049 [Coemansia sp. RSA 1199]